jgi:hypothetical protein
MSTVKITQLEEITSLNSNTSNTILVGVSLPTMVTGKITATTLAKGLYSHNQLNVGNNAILFPNTVAQFAATSNNYVQTNLQNVNNDYGTADHVITANTGSDVANYIDLGFANRSFNNVYSYNGLTTSLYPLDGYLYVQGNTAGQPGGNLVIGTTSTNREIRFIAGGNATENIVVRIGSTGLDLRNNANLSFTDGSIQTTAAASNAYSVAAYAQANTNATNLNTANTFLQANDVITLASAKSYTDAANTFLRGNDATTLTSAKSYTDAANTALKTYSDTKFLANTTGTFAGDLTITGNTFAQKVNTGNLVVVGTASISGTANLAGQLNVNGGVYMNSTVVLANSTFAATDAALTITATPTVFTPANDGYMLHISGKTNISSRIVQDSFGTGVYSLYSGRSARGSVTNPTAIQTGDVVARYSASGFGETKFQPLGTGRIDFVATENYTDANTGSQIQFWNCPIGSNTLVNIATFNGLSAQFSGVVNPQKGFVYTPNVVSGITTTLNIDIANNSLYKVNTNTNATINLSNYQAGKVVEVWITNSDNNNHTVTHGCLANNSTVGSTSFTLTSGRCAYLKYFSINGDSANTFVSINYS